MGLSMVMAKAETCPVVWIGSCFSSAILLFPETLPLTSPDKGH